MQEGAFSPGGILPRAATRFGDKSALVTAARTLSYRNLDAESGRVAAALAARGVQLGIAVRTEPLGMGRRLPRHPQDRSGGQPRQRHAHPGGAGVRAARLRRGRGVHQGTTLCTGGPVRCSERCVGSGPALDCAVRTPALRTRWCAWRPIRLWRTRAASALPHAPGPGRSRSSTSCTKPCTRSPRACLPSGSCRPSWSPDVPGPVTEPDIAGTS